MSDVLTHGPDDGDQVGRQRRKRAMAHLDRPVANFDDLTLNDVVRSVVDIKNHVLETNEHDNAAYAYVQITGESVRIIERGQGNSPWDPAKKVFTDR